MPIKSLSPVIDQHGTDSLSLASSSAAHNSPCCLCLSKQNKNSDKSQLNSQYHSFLQKNSHLQQQHLSRHAEQLNVSSNFHNWEIFLNISDILKITNFEVAKIAHYQATTAIARRLKQKLISISNGWMSWSTKSSNMMFNVSTWSN